MNRSARCNGIDRLTEAIKRTKNPTVAGLDTLLEYLPESFRDKFAGKWNQKGIWTFDLAAQAITEFNKLLIDALCDIVPAVKIQAACYEMYGLPGMKAFMDTINYAKFKGMLVISDVKRGDIGSSAQCYSAAHIGRTAMFDVRESAFDSDFATVNAYLGEDGITPFIKDCAKFDKGIFILAKTSNPSSSDLQDLDLCGKPLYWHTMKLIKKWGEDYIGKNGYSLAGAVVGATYPKQSRELRKAFPGVFFLVPGYGAQGANAKDVSGCFDENGLGAIINASRSLICAYKTQGTEDFAVAARAEAIKMRDDINHELKL